MKSFKVRKHTKPRGKITRKTNQSTEINAAHLEEEITRKQEVFAQKIIQTATAIKNAKDPAEGDRLFRELLVKHTNYLVECARQKSQIKKTPYSKQFSSARKRLNLQKNDSTGLLEKQFKEIKKLIDNSSVITAFPHNVTQFKAGAIYNAYREKRLDKTITNLIIASLHKEMPDNFKRATGDNGITRPATPLEIGEQCWHSIYTSLNQQDINQFEFSCQNLLKAREIPDQKTAFLAQRLDDLRLDFLDFQEPQSLIDDSIGDLPLPPIEAPCDKKPMLDNQNEKQKPLHVHFKSNLMHQLIPEKNRVILEGAYSFPLRTYMEHCLPKKSVSKIQDRENRLEFFFNAEEKLFNSTTACKVEVQGKIFEPSLGISSYDAKPENFVEKILEFKEKYDKKSSIDPRLLKKSELVKSFFEYANAKIDSLRKSEKNQAKKHSKSKGIIKRILNKNVINFKKTRLYENIEKRYENYKSELERMRDIIEENGLDKVKICFTHETYGLQFIPYTRHQTTNNRFENSNLFFTTKNLNDLTQGPSKEAYGISEVLAS